MSALRSSSMGPGDPLDPNPGPGGVPRRAGAKRYDLKPGEMYTIRRQVLKLLGAAFHLYNPAGEVVGYCKQAALKLKEDIRVYTDESCAQELLTIKARSIIDFSATYDIALSDGTPHARATARASSVAVRRWEHPITTPRVVASHLRASAVLP